MLAEFHQLIHIQVLEACLTHFCNIFCRDIVIAELAAPALDVHGQLDLERLVAQLPAGCRSVLVLHDVEGFTHEEIAASLGIAVGTSKAHLFRARRLLRRWLSLDEGQEAI